MKACHPFSSVESGIVTAFTLSTYPIHQVWGGIKTYSPQQLPALFFSMSGRMLLPPNSIATYPAEYTPFRLDPATPSGITDLISWVNVRRFAF